MGRGGPTPGDEKNWNRRPQRCSRVARKTRPTQRRRGRRRYPDSRLPRCLRDSRGRLSYIFYPLNPALILPASARLFPLEVAISLHIAPGHGPHRPADVQVNLVRQVGERDAHGPIRRVEAAAV